MPKNALLSIDGTYRRIKAGFITAPDSLYHKLRGAYITVGGIYRPFWSIGPTYYGKGEDMGAARCRLAATSVGGCALFGGGFGSNSPLSRMDAYDAEFIRREDVDAMRAARQDLAAATVGERALFAGGRQTNNSTASGVNNVDAYDAALTLSSSVTTLNYGAWALAGTAVGQYAIFAGGRSGDSTRGYAVCIRADLGKLTPASMRGRHSLAAATVGDYALFAGGHNGGSYQKIVTAYNSSGVQSTAPDLSQAKQYPAAASVDKYAIFAGGYNSNGAVTTVDAYNASKTLTSAPPLSAARQKLAATTVGGFAIFAGGTSTNSATGQVADADIYDAALTHSTLGALKEARLELAAATAGNYAIFAGGSASNVSTATVEAYKT